METRMDNAIHVKIKVVKFKPIWIRLRSINWHSNLLYNLQLFFHHIHHSQWVLVCQPSIKSWDTHLSHTHTHTHTLSLSLSLSSTNPKPNKKHPNPLLAQILLLLQPTIKTHKNPIGRNRRHSAANPQHHLLWKFEHKTYI